MINTDLSCCGINEIESICDYTNNPEITIEKVCDEIYNEDKTGAFLIFSDIGKKQAAKNLIKFIKQKKLGTITASPTKKNPNSKNSLKMWIWTLNRKNLRKYANDHQIINKYDNDIW